MFLGITVAFGAFAISALPFALLFYALIVACRWTFGHRPRFRHHVLFGIVPYFVLTMMVVGISDPRGPARQTQCRNNLQNIVLALQNYHDVYGQFPPACVRDQNGRPMHSWRVLILPFIEQRGLYEQYDFTQPWDSPKNRKLTDCCIETYRCPEQDRWATTTSYVAVVGQGTAWPQDGQVRLNDFADGTDQTLLLIEVLDSGIHWGEPRDLDVTAIPMQINPRGVQGISSYHPHDNWGRPRSLLAYAALANGSVIRLPNNLPEETIRAMLTINGGEHVEIPRGGF